MSVRSSAVVRVVLSDMEPDRDESAWQEEQGDKSDYPHRDRFLLRLDRDFVHFSCHSFHLHSRLVCPFGKHLAGL